MEKDDPGPRPIGGVSDISSDPLRKLFLDWTNKKGSHRFPSYGAIDILDHFKQAGSWIIMDVVDDGQDYLIRLLGSELVSLVDFDPTGLTFSQAQRQSDQVSLLTNSRLIYDRVVSEQQPIHDGPVKTTHTDKSFIVMESISLPLGPAEGPVTQIVGAVHMKMPD